MVAQLSQLKEHQHLLIAQLKELPQEWAITPVYSDKRPYRKNWQSETPITKNLIERDIRNGKAKGYGLRTGKVSGGIIAVDADGHAAHEKILELSGGVPLPETISFTSNKPGRCQYLFYIPQEYWDALATKKISTGVKENDGKEQHLELRWDGCQSVLPSSEHPETGFYRWRKSPHEVALAPCPMWIIEQMLDKPEKEVKHPAQIELPVDAIIPLTACLTHRSRYMLLCGSAAPDKGRNDSGIELARDLSGTANYLDSLGQRYDKNPENLFFDWCRTCGLDTDKPKGQPKAIWNSANKGNSTPGSGRDGVDACIRGWHWRENIKPTGRNFSGGIGSGSGRSSLGGAGGSGGDGGDGGDGGYTGDKVILHPSFNPIPPEQLEARLDALIQEGLSSAKLTHRLNQLAAKTGRHVVELRKQYSERLSEIEREEGREDTQSQVDALIDASLASVNLLEVLPRSLASPLLKLAGWLNLKPECYLTALLTTTSILHKAGTKVVLNKEWDFEVTPNLYSAIIAPSSQKKSPIIKAICTKPLKVLQREALEEYKHQLQIYQEELKEWEATKPEERGQPPVEPKRKIYFFTKTTGEGLTYQSARCPEQGMLYLSDELAGMLNAQNQYRGGKGSDKQDLLSNYDGTGDVVLRAEGVKSEVDFVLLGILGGIQPKVMQKLLGTCDDPDGGWARFTFINQPVSASKMSADGGKYDLSELLTNLYRRIDALPPTEYRLSPKAFSLFCKAYNRLEELRVGERLEGMQSVWGKSEGRIGKLAVNLHVIHALMNGKIPSEEISVEMVRIAINLTKFYAQQVQSLYTQFSEPDALAPQLVKVIELSRKKGWLKASDVYLSITKAHRPSGETVREWFGELVAMGKGEVKGLGRSLQFRAFLPNELPPTPPSPQDIRQIRQELDNLSNAEITVNQEVQEKLDKLDNLDDFLKPDEVPQNLAIQDESPYVLDSQGEEIQESFNSSNLSNSSNESHKLDTVGDTRLDNASNPVSNLSKVDAKAPSPAFPGEPDAPTVEELADDPWMSEENIAEIVKSLADITLCDHRETLAMLCEIWKPHAMKAACKRLTPERHAQIMQWVLELNCQGKMYRYIGSDYSIQRLCKAHPLTVESIKGEIAIVSSPNWSEGITNEIPFAALKKLE